MNSDEGYKITSSKARQLDAPVLERPYLPALACK